MTMRRFRLDWQDGLLAVLAVAGVIVYVIAATRLDAVGFPLDDSWIHQTYGRNLAERGEWAFVPGEASVASTSPLFTVLLAVGYVIGVPFFAWVFTLGAFGLALTGWIGRRVGAIMFPGVPQAGLWTGLALVTMWHLAWAASSGMETILFCAFSLGVVRLALRELHDDASGAGLRDAFRRGAAVGLVGAALTLTRPEGVGLVGLTGLFVLLAWPYPPGPSGRRQYLAWASGVSLAWLAGVAPYLALNYRISGAALPDTVSAKQAEHVYIHQQWSLLERYARLMLPLVAGSLVMLLPGVVVGLYQFARRARVERHAVLLLLPLGWAAADLTAYALRLPANYQHGRYVIPILPHVLLYGVGGTLVIVRAGRRRPVQRVLSRSLGLSAVLITAGFWFIGAQQFGRDVRIINTEMVATAKWIETNLPPDELLAVHDIGAVGYYAPRPILDLAGLVSPEVVPIIRDHHALMVLMCEREVRYLMVLPNQRPAEPDDPRLGTDWEYDPDLGRDVIKPLFRTDAPYAVEAGGGNMTIYRMNWPDDCG